MQVIRYRFKLTEPVLAANIGGDANARSGFPYLPGNLLRGCLVGKYRNTHPSRPFEPSEEEIRRLFFDGRTRYLNVYPWSEIGGARALPVPRSWAREKHNRNTAYDLAVEPQDGKQNLKPLGAPFWIKHDGSAKLLIPQQRLTVHTQRARMAGRATERDGAVYRYDALEAWQWFEGFILCTDLTDAGILKDLLNGRFQLGTARSAGYGGAEIVEVAVENGLDWREIGGNLKASNRLCVTLLSDVLVRDGHGQPSAEPEAFAATLSRKLNIPLNPVQAFVASRPVSGFNRTWNLPFPQQPALVMGSVLVYTWPQGLDTEKRDKLQELEREGIGERRTEGFGRFVVNWLDEEKWTLGDADAAIKSSNVPTLIPASDAGATALATRMAARLLRQRLDRRLAERAEHFRITTPPTKAQLGRLRLAVRNELLSVNPGFGRIKTLVESIQRRHRVNAAYERSRIGNDRLLDWIKNAIDKANDPAHWKDSLFKLDSNDIPRVGSVGPDIGLKFRLEYLLRLLDAILARAQKQQTRRDGISRSTNDG